MSSNPVGRPTVMTPAVIRKLEEAFAWGCTDREAYFYAGVSRESFYNYQEVHPEFRERKEALKEQPILKARKAVIDAITSDPKNAQWYLERKNKTEFAPRTELTGKEGDPVEAILHKYELEGGEGDRKSDGPVPGPPEGTA